MTAPQPSKKNVVVLFPYECRMAALVGIDRTTRSREKGRVRSFEPINGYWDNDVEGACVELAHAKFRNRYWGGHVNLFGTPDVDGVHVRRAKNENGALAITDKERINKETKQPANKVFALWTGECGVYTYRGAMTTCELSEHPEWLGDSRSGDVTYFVPQDALHDSEDTAIAVAEHDAGKRLKWE